MDSKAQPCPGQPLDPVDARDRPLSRLTPHPLAPQAATTKAAKAELAGNFDEAFKLNIEAAQTYLYLVRNTTNEGTKAQLRAVSAKVLERAERIKAAKKQHITPVDLSRLSQGECGTIW